MEPRLPTWSGSFGVLGYLGPALAVSASGKQEACQPVQPQQRWAAGCWGPRPWLWAGPLLKRKRFSGPLPGCLNLFWQARRRAVDDGTPSVWPQAPVCNKAIQADYRGTTACARRCLIGRERIADRRGNERRGERLPCWPGVHHELTGQPTRAKSLHHRDGQQWEGKAR